MSAVWQDDLMTNWDAHKAAAAADTHDLTDSPRVRQLQLELTDLHTELSIIHRSVPGAGNLVCHTCVGQLWPCETMRIVRQVAKVRRNA